MVLETSELHRLFDELELRERAMIVCDALTGMRRSELMGLQWHDLDFIGRPRQLDTPVEHNALDASRLSATTPARHTTLPL